MISHYLQRDMQSLAVRKVRQAKGTDGPRLPFGLLVRDLLQAAFGLGLGRSTAQVGQEEVLQRGTPEIRNDVRDVQADEFVVAGAQEHACE